MTEPSGAEQLRDRTEDHAISKARNDAVYALAMSQRPEATPDELRALIGQLVTSVREVAHVAELRGERLNSPATRALEDALRAALGQR